MIVGNRVLALVVLALFVLVAVSASRDQARPGRVACESVQPALAPAGCVPVVPSGDLLGRLRAGGAR